MNARSIEQKVYHNVGNPAVERLIPEATHSLLDVGCGHGGLATALAGKGIEIDGITISQEEASLASRVMREVYVHNLEDGLPPIERRYEVVVCSHVLEHIADPRPLLTDISSVLRPGGRLIIAVPNIMHYRSRLELLKGNFHSRDTGIWDNTHLKWYTFKSAAELLKNTGFELDNEVYERHLPMGRIRRALGFRTPLRLPNGVARRFKGLISQQIVLSGTTPR